MLLEWSSHSAQLVEAISTLLEQESLLDVTIAAGGKHIKVHKVILSAASEYFRELLDQEAEQLPIIYLRDVSFEELKWLVQFIYSGKTDVPGHQLSSFLSLAHSLKVKGFSENDTDLKEQKAKHSRNPSSPTKRKLNIEPLKSIDLNTPILKHTSSEPVNVNEDEDILNALKKRKTASLDANDGSPKKAAQERLKGDTTPLSPLSLPPLWSAAPISALALSPDKENEIKHEDSNLFKKPFTPPPLYQSQHAPSASCPAQDTSVLSEEATPTSPHNASHSEPLNMSNLSFDASLLDPNELAAKGATLLHHLAVWMIEEKKAAEELEKSSLSVKEDEHDKKDEVEVKKPEVKLEKVTSFSGPQPSTSSISKRRLQNQSILSEGGKILPKGGRRCNSECDRPDSGFAEGMASTGDTPHKEVSGGSSPEGGEMSRGAALRQPVLRKRRLLN